MPSIRTVGCYFHPKKLNSSWCVKCGKPICHECDCHSIFVASGYSVCPPCKSKQFYLMSAVIIPIFAFFTFFTSFFLRFVEMLFPFLVSAGGLVLFIHLLILNIKNKHTWEATINGYPASKGAVEASITAQKIISCNYHPNSPSIGKCAVCRREICLKCSRIKGRGRYSPAQSLCIGHYWKKQGKFFLKISIIFLTVSFIPLIPVVIFGSSLIFLIGLGLALGLPFLFIGGAIFLYYTKIKWDYQNWQKEVGFELE